MIEINQCTLIANNQYTLTAKKQEYRKSVSAMFKIDLQTIVINM